MLLAVIAFLFAMTSCTTTRTGSEQSIAIDPVVMRAIIESIIANQKIDDAK